MRFLHLLNREVGTLIEPTNDQSLEIAPFWTRWKPGFWSTDAAVLYRCSLTNIVTPLEVAGETFQTWQEAVEREETLICLHWAN